MKGPTTLCEREITERKRGFYKAKYKKSPRSRYMPYKVAVNILRGRKKIVN